MTVVAVLLVVLGPCFAADAATKVWVNPGDARTVWGRLAGRDTALFDARVRTEKGFAPPAGWSMRGFSLPSLSPDGLRVAFEATSAQSSAVGIYRLDSEAARILETDCDAQAVAWSPDGRYLAIEDSKGLLNNAVRVMGRGDDLGQFEISGDVLADLGHDDYRFRSGRDAGLDVWRTEVYDARWPSERVLAFKIKKVHLTGSGVSPKPSVLEETRPEDWTFDVTSKKLAKL